MSKKGQTIVHDISMVNIPFIHLNHLKQNKMISGRPKDLNDLSQLLRIEELRKK
jgi:hypothetical protein